MLHSSKSCSLFDIVLFYVIMYDSLNKNLSVITDFYFDVFPKSVGIVVFLCNVLNLHIKASVDPRTLFV